MKRLFFALILILSLTSIASAATTVTLMWDKNPAPELVTEYIISWGTQSNGGTDYPDFSYQNSHSLAFPVGQDITSYTISLPDGISPGTVYYFAAQAARVNSEGVKEISLFSNEVTYTEPPDDLTTPQNLNIRVEISIR